MYLLRLYQAKLGQFSILSQPFRLFFDNCQLYTNFGHTYPNCFFHSFSKLRLIILFHAFSLVGLDTNQELSTFMQFVCSSFCFYMEQLVPLGICVKEWCLVSTIYSVSGSFFTCCTISPIIQTYFLENYLQGNFFYVLNVAFLKFSN